MFGSSCSVLVNVIKIGQPSVVAQHDGCMCGCNECMVWEGGTLQEMLRDRIVCAINDL